MTLHLRLATESDLARIMQLENASFPTDAWPEDSMRFELNGPHTSYFVAFDAPEEQNLIGYGGLAKLQDSPQADIQTIAIGQDSRGKGFGKKLLERLIEEARNQSAEEIFLEVRADNQVAQGLYLSLGFEQIGRAHV